jgi:HEAT repeat protein/outer membrane protein assembly factor BamB
LSASVTTRVQEILERGAGRSLVETAWEHVAEPHLVREIYAVLRRREPKTALEATRVRFLEEERYRRDGKIFRREMYEVVEALGDTAARWLPYLIAHADLAAFSLVLGRLGDARAIPFLAPRLTTAKGSLQAAVVDALGRLRALECVDALLELAHAPLPPGERDRIGHRRVVANACLALGRIGDPRATAALLDLVTDPAPEMESVVPRAIVALGWLGDGHATHGLLPLLEGRHRNAAMYALARIADRSSTSHVEAAFARTAGPMEQVVYPRLMLEALRSRLGRSVDADVARYALTVIMANRFEATELHETSLRMLAVHGKPEELAPLARRFLDAETPRVRIAALGAMASAGQIVTPAWLDRPRVDELFRREGVRGLAGALADPDSVFRHNVIRKAAEAECGAELEGPALAALRTMVAFPRYSEEAIVDRPENTFDALEAVARFHTPAADQLLVQLLDHPNVMIRGTVAEIAKVDVYGASERLREALRRRVEERGAPRPTLPVSRLGGGPWVFGPPVRGLVVDRAGSRVVAFGEDKLVLFDADGTLAAVHRELGDVVACAFDRAGERLAVVVSSLDARASVFDARSGELAFALTHQGGTKTSSVAIAADGQLIVGTGRGRLVKGGERSAWSRRLGEPIIALAVHPTAPHVLVATASRVAWYDERDGAERVSSARGAKIRSVAFDLASQAIAVVRSGAVDLLDAKTLRRVRRVSVAGALAAVFVREGRALVVAIEGRDRGLVRIDPDRPRPTRIVKASAPIRALGVDPVSSIVLSAGDGVRVDLWDADGTSSSLPIAQHAARVVAIVPDAARGRAFSIGADDLVLQWDTESREIVAGWRLPFGERLVGAALGSNGRTLLVASARALVALDLVTGEARWRRALARIQSIASAPSAGAVWAVCGKGLVSVAEDGARVSVLRAPLDRGAIAIVDDARHAVAAASVVHVLDRHAGRTTQRLALGRTRAVLVRGSSDVGLVIATGDAKLRRFEGTPLEPAETLRLERVPDVLALDDRSGRVAIAFAHEVVVLEGDLRERARVRLEHPVSAMAFAEASLLVCGGTGGEVSVVETER